MTVSTHGVRLRRSSAVVRAAVELLSSMRFAIALLTVICIASVIGTVLKQQEPVNNYINQFGPFWAEVFLALKLNAVYSAWWFLLILAFLVTSTSLCIARQTPRIFADLRTFKEDIRVQSLRAFGHRAQASLAEPAETAARRIGQQLADGGWKVKLQPREAGAGQGWMVAARAGGANRIGYLAAHSAIVLVCLGGLLDGDLIVRAQMLLGNKTPYRGGGLIADVKPEHRLSERNPTFRGNLLVAEGTASSTAILNQSDGILIQELPFTIELKKFIVEHYSTGMPKLFASEIVIHDRETGRQLPARVEVNKPVSHRGIEIFQSSFDDGGSTVKLRALPIAPGARPFEIDGVVGGSAEISNGKDRLTIELTALRVINVENMAATREASGADPRRVDLRSSIEARLGAGNKTVSRREQRNVGPSITYKLRDAAGQAREFHNYMLPVDMGDGPKVYLFGVRESPAEPMRYMRIPADADGSLAGFLRLRESLADPAQRAEAVSRYAVAAVDSGRPELATQLADSAGKALTLFAGGGAGERGSGLQAVSAFLEDNVAEAERERAGAVIARILSGTLAELLNVSRRRAGLAELPAGADTQAFVAQSILALSDLGVYPAPVVFELADFKHVQASVFQVARAPGRLVVYLGCALLIIGVFAMLYIRERRLWVWVEPAAGDGSASTATMALSVNRKTLDIDAEFSRLRATLLPA